MEIVGADSRLALLAVAICKGESAPPPEGLCHLPRRPSMLKHNLVNHSPVLDAVYPVSLECSLFALLKPSFT